MANIKRRRPTPKRKREPTKNTETTSQTRKRAPRIPTNMVELTDDLVEEMNLQRQKIIYWIKNYYVNGYRMGRKIGGRWFIDLDKFEEFLLGE